MNSISETDIALPRAIVAESYADPANMLSWMPEIEKYEALSGKQGSPGSTYRLIQSSNHKSIMVTVLDHHLPERLLLKFENNSAVMLKTLTFVSVSLNITKIISEEIITFKGLINRIKGTLAKRGIEKEHHKQTAAFAAFAMSIRHC